MSKIGYTPQAKHCEREQFKMTNKNKFKKRNELNKSKIKQQMKLVKIRVVYSDLSGSV